MAWWRQRCRLEKLNLSSAWLLWWWDCSDTTSSCQRSWQGLANLVTLAATQSKLAHSDFGCDEPVRPYCLYRAKKLHTCAARHTAACLDRRHNLSWSAQQRIALSPNNGAHYILYCMAKYVVYVSACFSYTAIIKWNCLQLVQIFFCIRHSAKYHGTFARTFCVLTL